MSFKDHFSGHADAYADARPTYPPALFAQLAALAPDRALAWDAGCGNGQAALELAQHFDAVLATDPSAPQIANATPHPRVRYAVEPAERCSARDSSVDLVSVAQAYHWFDPARFADEVRRVARPGAIVAVYGYDVLRVVPAVDAVIDRLYDDVLGAYWPPERSLVDAHYATLPFPWQPLRMPGVAMQHDWTLPQLVAYLGTWSAAQRCRAATGVDAIAAARPALERAWGDPSRARTVRWNLFGRVGRVAPPA
ncbi:MAG TPA: class I SAM-dependent methyltransferase [Xanthomonadales bacterium]|nr:class I SAM-dependent methyltransferase [Xanthomonadales bacterium]